jgi:hypothetical protein
MFQLWKCGRVEFSKCRSMNLWKCRTVEVRKYGSMKLWKCRSVELCETNLKRADLTVGDVINF